MWQNEGFNAGFTRQARNRIAGLLSCSSAPFSHHTAPVIIVTTVDYKCIGITSLSRGTKKHISVKTVSVETMTSVSPFCGVHTELYSHVEWRLFGCRLYPNLGIISPHLVLFLRFFLRFLRCCAFCFAFFAFFFAFIAAVSGRLRFLLLTFRSGANGYRDEGGLGVFSDVGFEVKRKQACTLDWRKEKRGCRFILRG